MAEGKKGMSKGCLIALIVCAIIAVIIIAMAVVCYVYKDELIEAGLSKMTESLSTELIKDLPEGVTEMDVTNLMDEFKLAIKEQKVDQFELQQLSGSFQKIMEDKVITKDEGKDIIGQIRKAIDN
jgi:ABC-type transport system involved in cytochrome bd biosynthesis fused ATPase/permease subunit